MRLADDVAVTSPQESGCRIQIQRASDVPSGATVRTIELVGTLKQRQVTPSAA